MDSFSQHFYGAKKTAGVPFRLDDNQRVWCYAEHFLTVSVDGTLVNPILKKIRQPMTPLGLMDLQLQHMGSSFDGINTAYLTPEATLSLPNITDTLKMTWGMSTPDVSRCRCEDNHVSLLFNMLRFTMLQEFKTASRGNLNGMLGMFTDNGLNIDMDQWWTPDYAATSAFTSWPMQPTVDVTFISEVYSKKNIPALDLRGLSAQEALFVLIMLNGWKRSSRYRLDASLPALAETVEYRGPNVDEVYAGWVLNTATVRMPNANTAWGILSKYVALNRLYHHFSVALYIVTALTYQYVPDVAEATAWLALQWKAVLPRFYSIRGKFAFLNSGEGALLNQRAINEWNYIGNTIEKINLMALTFAQAFSMGIAVRGIRRCLELEPHDIHQTDMDFWNIEKFASAAVAEFTKIDVSLSGMSGIYITCDERLDKVDHCREVLTANRATDNVPDYHSYGTRKVNMAEYKTLMVPVMPAPGYPVFLTPSPTQPMTYNTPYNMAGTIDKSIGDFQTNGTSVTLREAWRAVSFLDSIGYDVTYQAMGNVIGPTRFLKGRYSEQIWPIYYEPEDVNLPVVLRQQVSRPNDREIFIPSISDKYFVKHVINYKYWLSRRGIAEDRDQNEVDVSEFGGYVVIIKSGA